MLKVGKKNYIEINIYYIGCVTVKTIANCNNINSVNLLYLISQYLVLDDADENKEVWKKYEEVWEGVKKEIEIINGDEKVEYGKDY